MIVCVQDLAVPILAGDAYQTHRDICRMLYGEREERPRRGHLWWPNGSGGARVRAVPHAAHQTVRVVTIAVGESHLFELRCNPTWAEPQGHGTRSKRRSLTEPSEVLAWLERQGERHGFRPADVQVSNTGPVHWMRKGVRCTVGSVELAGVLEITDEEAFARAYLEGVGRSRAFGFGAIRLNGRVR